MEFRSRSAQGLQEKRHQPGCQSSLLSSAVSNGGRRGIATEAPDKAQVSARAHERASWSGSRIRTPHPLRSSVEPSREERTQPAAADDHDEWRGYPHASLSEKASSEGSTWRAGGLKTCGRAIKIPSRTLAAGRTQKRRGSLVFSWT